VGSNPDRRRPRVVLRAPAFGLSASTPPAAGTIGSGAPRRAGSDNRAENGAWRERLSRV